MKRTHLDIMDYVIPALVIGFIIWGLLIVNTGLGSCLVPDTDCGKMLAYYGEQITVHGTAEEAEDYPLKFGYWMDSSSSQRVLKLRAWDGSWTNWSYGGDCELSSGSGWLLVAGTILSGVLCMAISFVLGFGVSLLIPRRLIESLYVQM